MYVFRPCGGNETAGVYIAALKRRNGPSLFALSRQGMPNLPGCTREGVQKGGYIVEDCEGTPQVIIMGTGSELPFAVEAGKKLNEEGTKARVVSMVCWELFDQ